MITFHCNARVFEGRESLSVSFYVAATDYESGWSAAGNRLGSQYRCEYEIQSLQALSDLWRISAPITDASDPDPLSTGRYSFTHAGVRRDP